MNVTCLSWQEIQKQGDFPLSAPSQTYVTGNTFFGINSNPPTMLTYSTLIVNFRAYTDVYDSHCGDGSYALELNTNGFRGNNAHTDWVQFTYQDYPHNQVGSSCQGHNSRICIWNINLDAQDYSQTWCKTTPEHGLSSSYEVIIEGFVVKTPALACATFVGTVCTSFKSYDFTLFMYAYVNGDYWGISAPDVYGLAGNWAQSSGGIMGEGGGSQAAWGSGTNLQTDIAASSCPNPQHGQLFMDCSGASAISATFAGDGQVNGSGTDETSTLTEVDPLLTSYYGGTHWWLTSVSEWNCGPNSAGQGNCGQFVNYGNAFGIGNAMTYTVEDDPDQGSVMAGGTASTSVTVTSVDGVVAGPITMSVEGMGQGGGLGTEDLTGRQCTPSTSTPDNAFTYVQPGSNCMLPLDVSTSLAVTTGGPYGLTITGSPPLNVPSTAGFLFSHQFGSENIAGYQLMIQAAAAPTPVIVLPAPGSYPEDQPVKLVGYATQYVSGQLGASYVDCSQLSFVAIPPLGPPMQATPSPDPSNPQYCDAQMTFSDTGTAVIDLTATNMQGESSEPASVSITITSSSGVSGTTPYSFTLSAAPSSAGVVLGGSVQFKITITCNNACGNPQPVTLNVGGLWSGAQYSLDPNPATPNLSTQQATVTLTIQAPTGTPPGTYTVTITGQGGGYTAPPCSVQLTIETLG